MVQTIAHIAIEAGILAAIIALLVSNYRAFHGKEE